MFDLVLRAVAISFGRDERGRTLLEGYDFHRYDAVDIGVSIASRSEVAPIIVFRDAAQTSLEEFHQQRLEKTREALEQQAAKREQLLRQTQLFARPRSARFDSQVVKSGAHPARNDRHRRG